MKAHLRKHEVFHNIANARENVVFNNSLGDRKRGSQHLVETSFQRLEDTDMRKIKTGEFPDVGWSVGRLVGRLVGRSAYLLAGLPACWLAGWGRRTHPSSGGALCTPPGGETVAEALSAPPGEGDRARSAFHHPQQYLPSTDRTRSTLRHPRQHPPSTREARSTDPSSTYPQHMKGYRRKTEAGNETTLKENGPYSRSMPAKRRKHAPKPATRGWKNIPLLIERFRRLWKTLKTWNSFENRCGKISKHAFSDCSKP